jgi:hypothetical protein
MLGCQHSLLKHCSHRCAGGPGWEQDQRRWVAAFGAHLSLRPQFSILIEQVTDVIESGRLCAMPCATDEPGIYRLGCHFADSVMHVTDVRNPAAKSSLGVCTRAHG